MKRFLFITISFYIFYSPAFCKQEETKLNILTQHFQSFEYNQAIIVADSLLNTDNSLNNVNKIEVYRMKAISHYALQDMKDAFNSFIHILEINNTYELNPALNSPKIVRYFDEIKNKYNELKTSTNEQLYQTQLIEQKADFSKNIGYSLLLPGLGHIQREESLKGWLFISATTISLASSIYFMIDANDKEQQYLNAVDKSIIENRYQKYNDAYRNRNIALICFTSIWLYSQLDLLFLNNTKDRLLIAPSINKTDQLQLNLQIRL